MKAAISNSASKADWQSSACAGTGVKRWQQWDPACNGCGLRGHHYSIAKDFDTSKISERLWSLITTALLLSMS